MRPKDLLLKVWDAWLPLALIVVSVWAGLFFGRGAVRQGHEMYVAQVSSRDWKSTHATVEQASLVPGCANRFGSRYSLHVVYAYDVQGQHFRNDDLGVGVGSCASRSEVESWLNRFPVGAQMSIHYDPQDPSRSMLFRGGVGTRHVSLCILASLMSLASLLFPVLVLWVWKKDRLRAKQEAAPLIVYPPMHEVAVRSKPEL